MSEKAAPLSIVRDPLFNDARMVKYAEAAALLKVNKRTIRRRVADGRYVAYGDGSGKRILYSSIVAELVMQCIEASPDLGATTYETYRQHARLYVLSQPIADIRVADLLPADLRAWVAGIAKVKSERTKKRLSGNTIRHAYDRIRVALLIAFEDKRIDWLPSKKLKLPRIEQIERRALTMDECNKLINYATNLRLAMIFKTYIATGMRESELIGLLWEMIDWQRKEIKLTSQLKWLREEKRWERVPLKNRKRRGIPVDSDYLTELRAH